MHHLTLAGLIYGIMDWHPQDLEVPVEPVIDSRDADEGSVFFAFEGEHVDGHDYVGDAFSRGAVAAVIEREVPVAAQVLDIGAGVPEGSLETPLLIRVPDVLEAMQAAARWWRRQLGVRVVGVTGSVGKTTTKEMVAQVLAERYKVVRSRGSYNNEIGLPLTLLQLDGSHERVVLEMGMYVRGDIRFLANIARPDVGIVTNVEPVHAERAGTIQQIALAKRELVEALPPAPEGVAILNYDDARVRSMAEHTAARVLFYGRTPEADLWADGVTGLGLAGVRARLHHGQDAVMVDVPLLGRHSIYPILRAAAAGLVEEVSWSGIVRRLEGIEDPLRLVARKGRRGTLILDDTYNSSPPSALAALDLLHDLEGRKIAVLGDMLELGDYEEQGHLRVGRRAAEVADELFIVGKLGELIGVGAEEQGMAPERIHAASDSEAASELLAPLLRSGDVVLVKGSRGVRMERIVQELVESES
ncbi:MAG: UDP-N-acetylmuramoyl-tripeptide--D-alanyl-D-alanine ligase [Anaerolineae bacterium]